MKADKKTANNIVAKYYDIIGKQMKVEKSKISRIELFEATEMICKGYAIIHVRTSQELNKDQKEVLVKIIKEI